MNRSKRPPDFLNRVRSTLHKYKMLQPGDRVLVALSGGPDSLALLHVLMTIQMEWDLTIEAAHFDHGLRGAVSEEEARWVAWQCREWSIPCHLGRWEQSPASGISPEAAAREARLAFLEKVQAQNGARIIAQGHHGDDQLETVVMRLLNGAGAGPLGGIQPVRLPYIRPLIEVEREAIEAYCLQQKLEPRRDASNQERRFLRNRLRLELIPLMKEYNPSLVGTVAKTAEILRQEDQFLQRLAREACDQAMVSVKGTTFPELDLQKLAACEPVLRPRVLRCWLGLELDFDTIGRLLSLTQGNKTGKRVDLKGGLQVQRTYQGLMLLTPQEKGTVADTELIVLKPGAAARVPGREVGVGLNFRETSAENTPERLVLPWKVGAALPVLRRRQPGDWFQLGYGKKKLKDWFIDRKIPRTQRDDVWLIAWGQQVLWALDQVQALGPFEDGETYLEISLVK